MSLLRFLLRRLFDRRSQQVVGSNVAGHVTQLRNVAGSVRIGTPPSERAQQLNPAGAAAVPPPAKVVPPPPAVPRTAR